MPFFSGLVGGISEGLAKSRADAAARAERQSQMENAILQHLSTSTDTEISSRAIAGLLNQADPTQRKAKGLRGFLGETEGNPALPMLRDFIAKGRSVTTDPQVDVVNGLPAQPTGEPTGAPTGAPPTQAKPGSAALPATPGIRTGLVGPPPPPRDFTRPGGTTVVPRQVFRTPDEQAELTAAAHERGTLGVRIEAYRAAQTPGERSVVPGVNNPPVPHAMGERQDPTTGQWYKQVEDLDPDTGERIIREIPISKVAPRPSAPLAKVQERARQFQAEATAAGHPGLSDEDAQLRARLEIRAQDLQAFTQTQTLAEQRQELNDIRMKAAMPQIIAAWQRVYGTTPMNEAQALNSASLALGNTTPEALAEFAHRLMLDQRAQGIPSVNGGVGGTSAGAPGASAGSRQGSAAGPPPGPPVVNPTAALPPGTGAQPRRLTAGQQTERTTAQTMIDLSDQILREGEDLGWSGVGGLGAGSVSQFLGNTFGDLAPAEAQAQIARQTSLRSKINRLFAMVGQLQGGQTFTGTELQIIKGYAPTINQAVPALKANLAAMKALVAQKLALAQANAGATAGAPPAGTGAPPASPTPAATPQQAVGAPRPVSGSAASPSASNDLSDLNDLPEGHKRTRANGDVWARVDGRLILFKPGPANRPK